METFCPECRQDVNCIIENKMLTATLKGKKYRFKGWEAVCPKCGENLYIGSLLDANLKAIYDEYVKQSCMMDD